MNDTLPQIIAACTLRGTLLIAVALLAGPWVRRIFGPNAAHWLWLAVLPVLLWPVPPHTPFSLRAVWPARSTPVVAADAPDHAAPAESPDAGPLQIKVRKTSVATPPEQAPSATNETKSVLPATHSTARQPEGWSRAGQWIVAVWALGAVVFLGQLGWRWRRTLHLLREARPITDARVAALLARFAKRGQVELAVISSIRAPALAGIWRPRILIPEGWLQDLSAAELESVLLHELGHHRRADLVWEWLYAIARCLHWMNPAVWLAEHLARQARELACDAWAMERSEYPEQYGEALLDALKRMQRGPALASFGVATMAQDAHQIARRLEWIARGNSAPRWLTAIGWLPALIALVVVGTDPVAAQAPAPSAPATAVPAPASPAKDENVASKDKPAPADPPLPLAKRTVEGRTRILRVPETLTQKLGWPIAEDGSIGVIKLLSAEEFRGAIATLRAAPGAELLPGPRLTTRSGSEGVFRAVREFRFGHRYKATPSGLLVPKSTESIHLGLVMEWKPEVISESSAHLQLTATLTRLLGLEDEKGNLTRVLAPPPGLDWTQRLVSYALPEGTAGEPSVSQEKADAQLVLDTAQVALVYGFRDSDRVPPPGATQEQTMVNYFAVQIVIAP